MRSYELFGLVAADGMIFGQSKSIQAGVITYHLLFLHAVTPVLGVR